MFMRIRGPFVKELKMSIVFNVDEVFAMAVDIERNGVEFYKKAAKAAADSDSQKMFMEFSAMEAEHAKAFAKMREGLAQEDKEPMVYDPFEETVLYLQVMAQAHGLEGKTGAGVEFAGNESTEEIIKEAVKAEEHSVAFYVGIKDIVFGKSGKEKVETIIREEMRHIRGLNSRLADLKG